MIYPIPLALAGDYPQKVANGSWGEQMKASITALSKRIATVEEKPDCGGEGQIYLACGQKKHWSRVSLMSYNILWLHKNNVK